MAAGRPATSADAPSTFIAAGVSVSARPPAARRTYVSARSAALRSATTLAAMPLLSRSLSTVVSAGCAPQPDQRRVRSSTPREEGSRPDREGTCTTVSSLRSANPRRRVVRTPDARECSRSSRQPGASLGATGLEDGAAGACAHPRSKPVLAGATTGVRLIRPLHRALLGTAIVAAGDSQQVVGASGDTTALTRQGYDPATHLHNRWAHVRHLVSRPADTCYGRSITVPALSTLCGQACGRSRATVPEVR